jgi:two-component system phosphate regulon sensor histidine kinase PhoR
VGDTAYDVLVLLNDVSEWKRLERMRSEFVANVSHELKTPIAAIRGFAETLLDGDVDAETQQSFLRTIYDESNRMSNLVTDLLELSKLEGAEHLIQPGRVVLQEIVEQAVHRLRPEAEKHQVTLEAEPSGDLTVWGSAERLLQVFLNLLSNAIYYTPSGGKVTVWTDVLVDRVKVHVTDTGIGIPEADQERVFERFYRVDRARSRASGGTGLGLAIVKHIINAHGGQVGVSSEVGRGSDFWFTLSRLEGALQEVQS